ncbi:GNAT family N-acetyltransferase [Ilumatobacter sp.]|uniref:GNAT family N-acetyltransferase n=1 Tax=Ilumatobacter sp. TaxID=1967498 RepID=UPI003B5253EE
MSDGVRRLAPAETHDLRRRVLRDGDDAAVVVWSGDDDPSTVHLGVALDGRVVAISTWLSAPGPDGVTATQLRGMATDPAEVGRGHGRALLRAGIDHARRRGSAMVWANARSTALDFYLRSGFCASGPEFETAEVHLPHRLVTRDVRDDEPSARG